MKIIILLGDGMADRPVDELGGQTPLEAANTPYMDYLASRGELGMVRTVKPGFPPGSDVANMAVMGLDPGLYYTGRAPIEAVSMGVKLGDNDMAFRTNLVTLSPRDEGLIMEDYSAGHISTEEASILIASLKKNMEPRYRNIQLFPGIDYRHLMLVKDYEKDNLKTTPPHDIIGDFVEGYLPDDDFIKGLIHESMGVLKDHPINLKRRRQGKREATAIWPWGQGRSMKVPTIEQEYNITGAMISAVDLMKGLGILRGMEVINVPGATGWIDTNYQGKAEAALDALKRLDMVYVHVEAPDEAGHAGLLKEKILAIENFDRLIVGNILKGMEAMDTDFRCLLLPDHPTPLVLRTHTADPVPFVIYDSTDVKDSAREFSERQAQDTGIFIKEGYTLLKRLITTWP